MELIVAIAIVALLTAIALPAIGWSREAARKTQCRSHLRQIGIAQAAYHADHGAFAVKGLFYRSLLPYVDQTALYERLGAIPSSLPPDRTLEYGVNLYVCPSDADATAASGRVSFLICEGNGEAVANGMILAATPISAPPFWHEPATRAADIVDGLSNTAFFAERLVENIGHTIDQRSQDPIRNVWYTSNQMPTLDSFVDECLNRRSADPVIRGINISDCLQQQTGYNHILGPHQTACFNGPAGTVTGDFFATAASSVSRHPGGCNVLFVDGSVHFVHSGVDLTVWRALGSRNGGETTTADWQ